jgi:hypothetical protein
MRSLLTLTISIILIFCSCKEEQKKESRLDYLIRMKNDVLFKGDTNSFYALFIENYHGKEGAELLPYSIIMSNKTDYDLSSYSVFWAYSCIYIGDKIDSIDEATAKMAIEYLEKAAKTGYETAINELNKLPKENKKMTYKEKFKCILSDE